MTPLAPPAAVTAYYERDGITIYCGDAREILPALGIVADMLLTDPPYPGLKGGTVHAGLGGVAPSMSINETVGVPWETSLDWLLPAWACVTLGAIVFCSYHSVDEMAKALEQCGGDRVSLLTWYKRNSPPAMANVPRFTTEFAWAFKKKPGIIWRNIKDTMLDVPMAVAGCMATERIVDGNGKAIHPTQKPVGVMLPMLSVGISSVLDCFMGTGTILVAAKLLGIRATGIEQDERYCEIAANRLAQGVLNFTAEVPRG